MTKNLEKYQQNKLPLSIIILTHRFDQRLEQALSSAQFAQEIILAVNLHHPQIKSQTLTQIQALQEKLSFKLIKLDTIEGELVDFSAARQHLLNKASYDWVFYLDSDEFIEPQSVRKISKIIKQNKVAGATVRRHDLFLGKTLRFGEVGQVNLLRLAMKDHLEWQRPVHEKAQVQGSIIQSKIIIWHQAHLSINEFIKDIVRYAYLEACFRQQKGRKFQLWQLLFYPTGKFIYNYCFKLGFLDGMHGLIYASLMSLHSLIVRVFQYELARNDQQSP